MEMKGNLRVKHKKQNDMKGHFHQEEFGVNWRLGLRQTPRT